MSANLSFIFFGLTTCAILEQNLSNLIGTRKPRILYGFDSTNMQCSTGADTILLFKQGFEMLSQQFKLNRRCTCSLHIAKSIWP